MRSLFGCAFAAVWWCSFLAWGAVDGHYIRVDIPKEQATLSLAEVQIFSGGKNVALRGEASQSETAYNASAARAIDGNTNTSWGGGSITHTPENHANPWWEVDLKGDFPIERIVLWNRIEEPKRLYGCRVRILNEKRLIVWEQRVAEPSPKDTALTVDETGTKGGDIGKRIPGKPATPEQVLAAYQKRSNWMDSALDVTEALPDVGSMNSLLPRLMQDFPESKEEIHLEFGNLWIFKAKPSWGREKRWKEMAQRLVNSISDKEVQKQLQAKVESVHTREDLAPFRAAWRQHKVTGKMQLASLRLFNAEAMERAIRAYAKQYPSVYRLDALLSELDAVRKAVAESAADAKDAVKQKAASKAVDHLNAEVYGKHPALQFKELLFVRRSLDNSPSGLPHNWQGNSSIPLHGYVNDLVRAPLWQQEETSPEIVYASSSFVGDVDLDYDADRVMFSTGKGNEKGWRVFEKRLDDSDPVQITPDDQNDIDFYDPCYLPDGRRLFVATSGFHGVPCVTGSDYVGNLHLMEKDGSIRRLVYDQDNSWCPMVMDNGRILFLRWEYTDSAHYFSRVLMTMNPDGTDQQEFFGSGSYWPNSLFFARTLPGSSTKFVGVISGHHGLARLGKLVLFDVARGRIETAGAVQTIPGYGKPVPNKTRDQLVAGVDPLFLHPYPLNDDLFLVSMRKKDVMTGFSVVLADRYDNLIPLWQSAFDNLYEPLPLQKRKRPTMPLDRVKKGEKDCTVYMVNAQNGPGLKGVPVGKVKALRVFSYEYSPRNTGGHYHIGFEGPWDIRTILGTVPVEEDGSCFFRCPANTPISVQTLDENGQSMQQMRSWLVGMPGETIACMGCHEKQNATAPRGPSIAGRKAPVSIRPWNGARRGFAFDREVQNVLDRACVGCHNDKTQTKNAIGQTIPSFEMTPKHGFTTAYFNLMKYVRRNGPEGDYHILTPLEFFADTSELIQILKKGHHGVKLTGSEMDRLVTWIDLNVPYWGTWTERENSRGEASAKRCQQNLKRRAEMAKAYSGIDYNAEEILNPYQKVAFEPPAKETVPAEADANPLPAPPKQDDQRVLEFPLGGRQLWFVRIPAGEFRMGSSRETPAERPVTRVKIEKAFWMAATEITQNQMREFLPEFDNGVYDKHYKDQVNRGYYMGDQDPDFAQPGHEDFPAIRVSWEQANRFCEWFSKRIGKKVSLPTEAQWEWACRAGTDTPFHYGGFDADFSKFANLADRRLVEMAVNGIDPKPMKNPPELWDYELRDARFDDGVLHLAKVGSYAPNAWGLYDMHGNVAEWTRSAYRPYPYRDSDGRNNFNVDETKTVRGGSWYRRPIRATSTWRWGYPGWMRPFDVGFRVVIED